MDNPGLKQIGKMMKTLRESAEMTQSELAKLAGLTQAAISQFEEGKRVPSTRAIHKVAEALGVSTNFLIAESPLPEDVDPEKAAAIKELLELVKDKPAKSILHLNRFIASVQDEE